MSTILYNISTNKVLEIICTLHNKKVGPCSSYRASTISSSISTSSTNSSLHQKWTKVDISFLFLHVAGSFFKVSYVSFPPPYAAGMLFHHFLCLTGPPTLFQQSNISPVDLGIIWTKNCHSRSVTVQCKKRWLVLSASLSKITSWAVHSPSQHASSNLELGMLPLQLIKSLDKICPYCIIDRFIEVFLCAKSGDSYARRQVFDRQPSICPLHSLSWPLLELVDKKNQMQGSSYLT